MKVDLNLGIQSNEDDTRFRPFLQLVLSLEGGESEIEFTTDGFFEKEDEAQEALEILIEAIQTGRRQNYPEGKPINER